MVYLASVVALLTSYALKTTAVLSRTGCKKHLYCDEVELKVILVGKLVACSAKSSACSPFCFVCLKQKALSNLEADATSSIVCMLRCKLQTPHCLDIERSAAYVCHPPDVFLSD